MAHERKDKLYHEMLVWICEHIHNDEDLFITLHEHFGMTMEELHDNSIESLDKFFTPTVLFKDKVKRCYEQYCDKWLTMTPGQLMADIEKIYAVTRLAEIIEKEDVSDHDAEYMLRFVNPLEVMSSEWMGDFGVEIYNTDDEISGVLGEIVGIEYAEQMFELEPEYQDSDEDEAPTVSM